MADSVIAADFRRVIAQLHRLADKAPSSMANELANATYSIESLSMALTPSMLLGPFEKIHLSPTERKILEILYINFEHIVFKDAILEGVYYREPDPPEPKILDIFICKLRRKLAETEYRIETAWGNGYRLVHKKDFQPTFAAEWRKSHAAA